MQFFCRQTNSPMRTYEEWWKALRWTFLKATNEIEKFSKNTIACKILGWHSHYLWFQPKVFSKGNINKKATVELIRRIFPRFWIAFQKFFALILFFSRFDADCVMKNIFEIFDSQNTGRVIYICSHFMIVLLMFS